MTSSPRGYDYVITENAEQEIRLLDTFHQQQVVYALNDLLVDPTVQRPTITEQQGRPAEEPQFVLKLGDLAVYFDMLNPYVALIRTVRVDP